MTTSRQTGDLDHPALRRLVHETNAMSLADRFTLLKALVPGLASHMAPREFESLIVELRFKGERFYEALLHPGQGREMRHVIGERDLEGR